MYVCSLQPTIANRTNETQTVLLIILHRATMFDVYVFVYVFDTRGEAFLVL